MLKLNVGASRKVTDNHYGSRGASINLELELDSALIGEGERLRDKMRQLFGLARAALTEELNGVAAPANGNTAASASPPTDSTPSPAATNASPSSTPPVRLATQSQIKALFAIARTKSLDLIALLRQRFAIGNPEELSLRQASQMIDELKNGTGTGQGKTA